mmetsp:Transcript_36616/g.95099  ORF Transcript_36616/g.95099 Transcript_36616/m.95099 type:complete len:99 (-) Transcript_36616:199-495(-)
MALVRQRVWACLLGASASAAAYFSTQRLIWQSTAAIVDSLPGASKPEPRQLEPQERLLGAYARACLVRSWNQGVDTLFGAAIQAVSVAGEPAPTVAAE